MSPVVPLGYLLAFTYFFTAYFFRRFFREFAFEIRCRGEERCHTGALFVALCLLFALLFYGVLSDINFSIQEGTNANHFDINLSLDWVYRFIRRGSWSYHQPVYHRLMAALIGLLQLDHPAHILVAARFMSTAFAAATAYSFLKLLAFVPTNTSRRLICCVFLLHPLNFFYFIQGEAYALLLLFGVLNIYNFLSLGFEQKRHFWGFIITAILGYLTHLLFFPLLAAEMLFALLLHLTKKRIYTPYYKAILLVIPVLFVLHWPVVAVFDSPLAPFIDGYRVVNLEFSFRQLCTFWGLTDVLFQWDATALIAVFMLLNSLLLLNVWRNRHSPTTALLSIAFILIVSLYLFFSAAMGYRGYSSCIARHYILLTIPFTILCFAGTPKRPATQQMQRSSRPVIVLLLLSLFVFTDAKIASGNYRYDGQSVARFLSKMYTGHGAGHVFLFRWLLHGGLSRWTKAYDLPWAGGIEGKEHFYQADLQSNIENNRWPGMYSHDDFDHTHTAQNLIDRIEKDGYEVKFKEEGTAIDRINNFLQVPGIDAKLVKEAKARNLRVPQEIHRLFRTAKTISNHRQEVQTIANRLLLELLYPQLHTTHTLSPLYIQKEKLKTIVEEKEPGEMFLFLVLREQILGMQYLDLDVQHRALATLKALPDLEYLFKKEFRNAEIHAFRRKQ